MAQALQEYLVLNRELGSIDTGFRWAAARYASSMYEPEMLRDMLDTVEDARNTGTYRPFDTGVEAFVQLSHLMFAEAEQ